MARLPYAAPAVGNMLGMAFAQAPPDPQGMSEEELRLHDGYNG